MGNKHQLTADGSSTLYTDRFKDTYHSIHGAIQESEHVFIKMGWDTVYKDKKELHVLEMGFGTGLNTLLIALRSAQQAIPVHYTSLEAFPISKSDAASLNYGELLNASPLFDSIHNANWNESVQISPYFNLHKKHVSILDFESREKYFDLVLYDAFTPIAQPELWTKDVFLKLHQWMNAGGVLTTYCAKGDVRRAMKDIGFKVERLPGPPGKREMLRAVRCDDSVI